MGGRFQILGSSSSGNCGLLETDDTRILIDAGFSGRRTEHLLRDAGYRIEDIEAVFITHEHGDHAAGVRGLSRHGHLTFFANLDTAEHLRKALPRPVRWKVFETGREFRFRDITIHPLTVPHDAYDPVCFFLEWGAGDLFSPRRSLGWVNDLGYVPEVLLRRLAEVETLVIEANHDEAMLEKDPKRPFSLKQRIRGRHGHLSNRATHEALKGVPSPTWKTILLSHLSRDCNDCALVSDTFAELAGNLHAGARVAVIPPDRELFDPITY